MTDVQPFTYKDHTVRVITVDGEPWFVLADLCKVLNLAKPSRVAMRIADDMKGAHLMSTLGGDQEMTTVSEAGMYEVVIRSDKPEAAAFRRWITSEVLPSIRKHGGYLTDEKIEDILTDPDTIIRLATDLKEARAEQSRLEAQAALDAPKVEFADAVHCSSSSISMGELAKLLRQNGYEVGRTRLFELLRNDGFLCRIGDQWNLPSQRAMESGLFEVHESVVSMNERQVVRHSTKVTGKGQRYFVSRFLDGRLPKNTVLNRPRTEQYL